MIVKTLRSTGQFMDCGMTVDCFYFNLERVKFKFHIRMFSDVFEVLDLSV